VAGGVEAVVMTRGTSGHRCGLPAVDGLGECLGVSSLPGVDGEAHAAEAGALEEAIRLVLARRGVAVVETELARRSAAG
jgi:hypothetical protein